MRVPIEAIPTPAIWKEPGATAVLRIEAIKGFTTSDGHFVQPSRSGSDRFYLEVPITISNDEAIIAGFEIDSTEDAYPWDSPTTGNVPGYKATIVTSQGRKIPYLPQFKVPALVNGQSSLTWGAIRIFNRSFTPRYAGLDKMISTSQALEWIQNAIGALNRASETNPGVTALTADPVDPAFPIAVSANDPDWLLSAAIARQNRIINVATYGAVGDEVADDTDAINLAIAAFNTVGRGRLYFPAGAYRVTGALTPITANGIVSGDGASIGTTTKMPLAEVADVYGTKIICESATARLFTVTSSHLKFQDLALVNAATSTPSDGAGIYVDGAHSNQKVDYESVSVEGFYINIDVRVGFQWSMYNCSIMSPVQYGLRINNTVAADAGDWAVINTTFFQAYYNSQEAIRIEGAGGGKISNIKINGYLLKFLDGIKVVPAATSILLISNASIENIAGYGINVEAGALATQWENISISNCEIFITPAAPNSKTAIILKNINNATISNVTGLAQDQSGAPMIFLDGCSNVLVTNVANLYRGGFGRLVQIANGYSGSILPDEDVAALTITGNLLTPNFRVSHVGAGLVKNITSPDLVSRRAEQIVLIPDSAFTYDNSGNLVLPTGSAGVAVINQPLYATWSPATERWFLSY